MDDVRDGIALNGRVQPAKVGHVAGNEVDLTQGRVIHEQPQSVRVFLEVVNPDAVAAFEEIADNPTADATVTAGEKYVHCKSSWKDFLLHQRCRRVKPLPPLEV